MGLKKQENERKTKHLSKQKNDIKNLNVRRYRKKRLKVGDRLAMHGLTHQCQDYPSELGPNCMTTISPSTLTNNYENISRALVRIIHFSHIDYMPQLAL